ncbi:acetate--CoA ligase [Nocardioides sp. T2.26MG-1]|uniref:acetate--CoA ligase n=1 Tax=Nocardioides sp. T2.26MG-1 TaxID=3041166 RepID=UPI002477B6BC|nr:acetate--CoA ligase [Nocardioides sp. T2.26MG-1]CAI9404367.1 Acetyl-coenzyme A synthetase [Nocardioides sp. T2.26MG-1]
MASTRPELDPAQPTAPDYRELVHGFTWDHAREALAGLPGGHGLNIAHEAVDRHVDEGRGDQVAIRCVAADGSMTAVTFAQLRQETSRFAHLLGSLGVRRGESVVSLLGRQHEQYVVCLGTLKAGAVFSPLFSSFGPDPIRERLLRSRASVLVTTESLYRRKIAPQLAELPYLQHIVLIGRHDGADEGADERLIGFDEAMAEQPTEYDVAATEPSDPALLHFTSGTTGLPKGAVHVHDAVVAHRVTAGLALDLHPGDVFWCTADPGWVTGTSYGIVAPLTIGATLVSYAGEFEAAAWYRILADQHVTVWYTAPTALRMLMRYGADLPRSHDLSTLRHVASVGEALNPEVVRWGQEALGLPIHDNWWQTETGAIMVSNYPGMPIRPGSMGRPMPGVQVTTLALGDNGRARVEDGKVTPAGVGESGELAVRAGWPSMFRTYLDDEERYRACFADGWYLSGDLASLDADGYLWFVGRADDVIKSAGHLIGPFEVESALLEHPAVVEAGVIGMPDELAGELVRAYVTVRAGLDADEALRLDLVAFARRRLGGLAPKEILFDEHLPHNSSGKVMRRVLKARALGLPEGDVSTMERVP